MSFSEKDLAADLHLHSQTPALPLVTSLAILFLFFILFYLFIIFKLNHSAFYNSSQVVKTRKKKLNYVTCNRDLHFSLPATSLAIDTNRACCQWRQDAVVVKRLKLISTIMYRACNSSVGEKDKTRKSVDTEQQKMNAIRKVSR